MTGVVEIISFVLNLVLGTGFIVTLSTLRSTKKEAHAKAMIASAEAKSNELQNVEAAIKIWRDIAQSMADKYDAVSNQVEELNREVKRLNSINNKIARLLNKITPDNLEKMVDEIKKELYDSEIPKK